ncbi:MAG: lanthionine synthetase C family protein [Prevotellaceae bacterium]|nr:lanthionine synthetase C family protein [Prevotellaceae bacterium]
MLFLFYYSKYFGKKKIALLTEEYAEQLLDRLSSGIRQHSYCDGLSGVLYLLLFLRENHFIDMDVSDAQPLLDSYLVTMMRHDMGKGYFDFMHGALGVGLYFLKRGDTVEYIRELIDFLYETAEKNRTKQTFKWKSSMMKNESEHVPVYNLALSHGISSIIIFLSRVIKSGMTGDKITEMLTGAVNYVLLQQKDFSQYGFCFPSYLPIDKSGSILRSRLAWCYGDLDVGIALLQAGKALHNTVWQGTGMSVLLQSTKRLDLVENFVIDAEICHGSAGIAMIFRRIFLETKRSEFAEATRYWLNQTLNFSRFEDGPAGYKTFQFKEWKSTYSLLDGIAGIGLVMMSCLFDDKQKWDEMFLLS